MAEAMTALVLVDHWLRWRAERLDVEWPAFFNKPNFVSASMSRIRMSRNQFYSVAKKAVRELPTQFHRYLENVVVDVVDEPSPIDMKELEGDTNEILGIFEGVSLLDQAEGIDFPNRVKLFRLNLEAASEDREDLICHIQETVIHEIGHHFGMTEEDLEPFERAMDERRQRQDRRR